MDVKTTSCAYWVLYPKFEMFTKIMWYCEIQNNHYSPPRTMLLLVGKNKIKFWPGICTGSGDGVSY